MADSAPEDFPTLDDFQARRKGLTTAQRIVRESALPIIGGALGAAAGTMAAPFTGGVANPVTGAMLGSGAGEFANQKLGITQPSLTNLAISGAAPAVPALARNFMMQLPGAAAGLQKFLQETIGANAERLLASISPAQPARAFWQALQQQGKQTLVNTDSVKTALRDIGQELADSDIPNRPVASVVASLKRMIPRPDPLVPSEHSFVPLARFRANMSQLGALVGELEEQGGRALGQVKKLYASMWDDLDASLTTTSGPQRELLTRAVDATKRESAEGLLTDWVSRSVSYRLGARQIDTNGLLTRIERHRDVLEKMIPAGDIDALKEALIPFAKTVPQMPSAIPRSATDKLIGAVTGAETISRMLLSPVGRQAIYGLAKHGTTFDQAVNTLIQSAESGTGIKTPPDLSTVAMP